MSKAANSIRKGLDEAVAYAKGRGTEKGYRVHLPEHVDVKAIRTKLGMTQQAFAGRFGFSINTLRHWEQGKREPEGPTRAYCWLSIVHPLRFKEPYASRKASLCLRAMTSCSCCTTRTSMVDSSREQVAV